VNNYQELVGTYIDDVKRKSYAASNFELTVHFMRAFYYYTLNNNIWHIHFKKVRVFAQDFLINQLMDDLLEDGFGGPSPQEISHRVEGAIL
jgi:hypothetical protein